MGLGEVGVGVRLDLVVVDHQLGLGDPLRHGASISYTTTSMPCFGCVVVRSSVMPSFCITFRELRFSGTVMLTSRSSPSGPNATSTVARGRPPSPVLVPTRDGRAANRSRRTAAPRAGIEAIGEADEPDALVGGFQGRAPEAEPLVDPVPAERGHLVRRGGRRHRSVQKSHDVRIRAQRRVGLEVVVAPLAEAESLGLELGEISHATAHPSWSELLEAAAELPVGDDLVEHGPLLPGGVEEVVVHVGAEGRVRDLAALEQVDRLDERRRDVRDVGALVRVALESAAGRARARCRGARPRSSPANARYGLHVGAGDAALDAEARAVADDPEPARAVVATPGDRGRRPRLGLVALVRVDGRREQPRELAGAVRRGRRASRGTPGDMWSGPSVLHISDCGAVACPTRSSGCGTTSRPRPSSTSP